MADSKEKRLKKLEVQINNAEKAIGVVEKINKEEQEKIEQEKINKMLENKRLKAVKNKSNKIKKELKKQLENQGKNGKYFMDMIEDYGYFIELKEDLQHDIDENGLRIETMTGNGYKTSKENKSVEHLVKVNSQMLKILQELDLKAPEEGEGDDLL